jgi:hypothetical protein
MPLVTALDVVAVASAGGRQWRQTDFVEFRRILPALPVRRPPSGDKVYR